MLVSMAGEDIWIISVIDYYIEYNEHLTPSLLMIWIVDFYMFVCCGLGFDSKQTAECITYIMLMSLIWCLSSY